MKTTYTYDHYYKYDELTEVLQKYAQDYPGYVRLSSLCTTAEGRSQWMIEITDLSSGDFSDKPGFALDGNVHAGEVTGCMACMYFLDTVLTNRDEPEIADLLKNHTIYCIPRISPDGSEHYLTTPELLRSVNKMYPYDTLQPGVQPKDMDNDGVIRTMRVKNPHGVFKKYEKDPRIMVRREPDDVFGDFYDVFQEGYVEKHDPAKELKPAPAKYGNDFNRNLAAGWGVGGRGGAYAFSNPETYAFANWLFDHKNICTCLNFHTYMGIYLYPPAMKSMAEASSDDMKRYQEIGNMIKEETGYPLLNLHDEFLKGRSVGGSLDDFAHYVLGILAFTCECWDIDARIGYPVTKDTKPLEDDAQIEYYEKRFRWMEENDLMSAYKDWTPFEHPQLGTVEIGGFDMKHLIQNPPEKYLLEEIEKHTRFMLREIKLLPQLDVEVKTEKHGELTKADVTVRNLSWLPTYVTDEGKKMKQLRPITVSVSGCEIIEGKETEEIGQLGGFSLNANAGWGLGATTNNHEPSSVTLHYLVKGDSFTVCAKGDRCGKKEVTKAL